MGFPMGNEYYKLRIVHGKDRSYTPSELEKGANEYFQFCIDTPLIKSEVVRGKEGAYLIEVPIMRVFSLDGLCNFLGICTQTFKNYEKHNDYFGVTTHIRQQIDSQQFEGAAGGLLNANIIARKLGLTDKIQHGIDETVTPPIKWLD